MKKKYKYLIAFVLIIGVGIISYTVFVNLNVQRSIIKANRNNEYIDKAKTTKFLENSFLTKASKELLEGYNEKEFNKNLAKEKINNAIKDSYKIIDQNVIVYGNLLLAEMALEENDYKKYIYYNSKAVDNIKWWNIRYVFKDESRNLDNLMYDESQYKYVLDTLNKISEKFSLLDYADKIEIYRYKSRINFYLFNYGDSIKDIYEAIKIATKNKDFYAEGMCYIDLANISNEIGGYKTGRDILKKLNMEIPDGTEKIKFEFCKSINLAELEILNQNYKKSQIYGDDAVVYEKKLNYLDSGDIIEKIERENIITFIQVVNYSKLNKLNKAKKAIEYYEEYVPKDLKEKYITNNSMYILSKGILNEAEGNLKQADYLLYKAYNIFKDAKDRNYMQFTLRNLIDINAKLNRPEMVNKYADMHYLSLKEVQDNVSTEYFEYLNEKEEFENIYKQNKRRKIINHVLEMVVIFILIIIVIIYLFPKIKKKYFVLKVNNNLKNNKYKLYYQPIVDPKEKCIVGFESLIRLQLGKRIIPPYILLKEIYKAKMLDQISIWILQKVLNEYNEIKKLNTVKNRFYISLNVNVDLIENDKFIDKIIEVIYDFNLKETPICIEILENSNCKDKEKLRNNINKLRELGFIIAIDDFGIDYSNISRLDDFKFDILKMDKVFVDSFGANNINMSIIEMVNISSIKNNKKVVFEGIETKEQMEFVKYYLNNKCYIQGYYYSKPVPINELKNININ